jgi:rhodanese-related sulfurtransferase
MRKATFATFATSAAATLLATLLATAARAAPQTVADEACPKYAVDIAAFATCEGDRVVKPEPESPTSPPPRVLVDDEGNPLPPQVDAIPADALARTHHGHYLTAQDAYSAKHWLGRSVLFIDVRDEAAVGKMGLPGNADFNLPVARFAGDGALLPAYGFVAGVKRALAARGMDHAAPIFVVCQDGRHAALAAELLAQAGVPHVFVVRGGILGEQSAGGDAFGWVAARLPLRPAFDTGA